MTIPVDRRHKDMVRAQFTRTAQVFGDFAIATRMHDAQLLARLLELGGQELAVDLACGPGTLALRFARHVRWICGLDLTPAMLERARRSSAAEGLANLDFALGDAQALPFADESLDVAVASYSLHHMPDPSRVIGQMARVVKRNGRVGVIDIRVPEDPKIAEMNNRIERSRDRSHTRTLAQSEFEALFAAHGLRITASAIEGQHRPFDHWMRVAGWEPGDREYIETRRMLEATMRDDAAGFHPRYASAEASENAETAEIHITNTVLFLAAEKA